MTVQILKSELDRLGIGLDAAIFDYRNALAAHAMTVDQPAPVAHPLVEQIVKAHGGAYEVIDDTPVESPAQARARLAQLIYDEMNEKIGAIASPARRQLAQIDLTNLLAKLERTPAEAARLADVQELFERIGAVARHGVLLQIEVEDLPDHQVKGWLPHWPAGG